MTKSKKIIGIDIGGTKISLLLTNGYGRVLARRMIPTRKGAEARRSVREMSAVLADMLKKHPVKVGELLGIGVGVPGPVDAARGVVPWSPNLEGWKGIRLKEILARRFRVPVYLDNDANAAAFGEKVFGAGKRTRDFVYITVSTGIGGGLVLGNAIHRGASFCGGEVGHMTLVPGGNRCKCGKRGCLEAYASGTAIARRLRERLKSKLPGGFNGMKRRGPITAELVSYGARRGDRLCIEILKEAGRYLGIGVANLINVLNPEMVVIGGSVTRAGSYLWKPMLESAGKESWPVAFKACRIRRTSLGDHAGNLGAAALVLQNRNERGHRRLA